MEHFTFFLFSLNNVDIPSYPWNVERVKLYKNTQKKKGHNI